VKKSKKPDSAEKVELWGRCHLGKGPRRQCQVCGNHRTSYCCEECEVRLCHLQCYDAHTLSMTQK